MHTCGTGLTALRYEIARARRLKRSLVVAFVDVDHLKAVNDTHGHAAGDEILVEVASALRARLRAYDLVIRYGGDEFVATVSGLTMADATERFASVNRSLSDAHGRGSVSVGIAELEPDDLPEELVARADAALYRERARARSGS